MDCLASILFLGAAIWFFISAVTRGEPASGREVWRQLALRFQATPFRGGWWSSPGMQFRYSGTPVTVRQQGRRRSPTTDAWINWPDRDLLLHIASTSAPLSRDAVQGMRIVDSPQDPFYWRHRVFTNKPTELPLLLGESVKWQIEQLRQYFPNRAVEIRIADGRLLVRKHFAFRQLGQLERFTRLALQLYDQMVVSQTAGIEILDTAGQAPQEPANCQICGEPILQDPVICRRCGTPHHRDCWEYNGACAVFGCRATDHQSVPQAE